MEAEKVVVVVVVTVREGWGVANNVVGDWADKVMERTGECADIGPRVFVNGFDKMAKRAVMNWLR